jgi:hypothetical protein
MKLAMLRMMKMTTTTMMMLMVLLLLLLLSSSRAGPLPEARAGKTPARSAPVGGKKPR